MAEIETIIYNFINALLQKLNRKTQIELMNLVKIYLIQVSFLLKKLKMTTSRLMLDALMTF